MNELVCEQVSEYLLLIVYFTPNAEHLAVELSLPVLLPVCVLDKDV